MIRVPSECTAIEVESLLSEVLAKPGQSLYVPIRIARGSAFGISALLVLVISRYIQINRGDARVEVSTEVLSNEDSRDRFAGTLHGMASVWLTDFAATTDGKDCRRLLLQAIKPYVISMANRTLVSTVRGPNVLLCCFQPAKHEFLSALYANPARGSIDPNTGREIVTVRSQGEFLSLIRDFQSQVSIKVDRMFNEGQLTTIATLLFQLFKNADVHTVTDEFGDEYKKSMRGLIVARVTLNNASEIEAYAGKDRSFGSFLARNITGRATGSFVELTVFDTGPGMVARLLRKAGSSSVQLKDISLDKEFEYTKACFEVHKSSQSNNGHGDGLDLALRALVQLKAFMSLRTGRMSLLQDFSSSETRATFAPKHRFPKDKLVHCGGTSYTICIPVPPV